ncbi:hypothetical protein EAE99_003760 [Botrytis elliptica]|nr:hypothetical protein EAE99_003760 [Botrytis elliptica]
MALPLYKSVRRLLSEYVARLLNQQAYQAKAKNLVDSSKESSSIGYEDTSPSLWDDDIGAMLSSMLQMAGYTPRMNTCHREVFASYIAPSLGIHPKLLGSSEGWRSFMTDDFTPVELSWRWSPSSDLPSVRYSIEPIGLCAGSTRDPLNTQASVDLIAELEKCSSNLSLDWHRHFSKTLLVSGQESKPWEIGTSEVPHSHLSQIFLAFDLDESSQLKTYYLPMWRAASLHKSTLMVVGESIKSLAISSPNLGIAFDLIAQYIDSCAVGKKPRIEIVSTNCTTSSDPSIKIYLRSHETSLNSVIDTMNLGGRLVKLDSSFLSSLQELWCLVLGISPSDVSSSLPERTHETSGILYYFEIKSSSSFPTPKVYIPAKHYGKSDHEVAKGLSAFLERRGKRLANESYFEGVASLCSHRSLSDGLGIHTYISCAPKGPDCTITSYINPEIYHISRSLRKEN